MTDKPDQPEKPEKAEVPAWAGKAALAGAALGIGSAAIAAALLFASRRKEANAPQKVLPPHPEDAPETD